jgi:hypothetical protein
MDELDFRQTQMDDYRISIFMAPLTIIAVSIHESSPLAVEMHPDKCVRKTQREGATPQSQEDLDRIPLTGILPENLLNEESAVYICPGSIPIGVTCPSHFRKGPK